MEEVCGLHTDLCHLLFSVVFCRNEQLQKI